MQHACYDTVVLLGVRWWVLCCMPLPLCAYRCVYSNMSVRLLPGCGPDTSTHLVPRTQRGYRFSAYAMLCLGLLRTIRIEVLIRHKPNPPLGSGYEVSGGVWTPAGQTPHAHIAVDATIRAQQQWHPLGSEYEVGGGVWTAARQNPHAHIAVDAAIRAQRQWHTAEHPPADTQ